MKQVSEVVGKRLRFASWMACQALETLRPGDWRNLRDELDGYFQGAVGEGVYFQPGDVMGTPTGSVQQWPVEAVNALQLETRRIFEAIVDRPTGPPTTPRVALSTQKRLLLLGPQDPQLQVVVKGDIRDVFLELLFDALNTAARFDESVKRCPQCKTLFFAPRQRGRPRQHCSAQCYDKWYWAQYPAAKKVRARKKQYEKYGWKPGARKRK